MEINSIQDLRNRAWMVRRHKNEHRTAEALLLHPFEQEEVERYLSNLAPPSEKQLETLTKMGYALREENRQPNYVVELKETLFPLWYCNSVFQSASISMMKSHRVVKGRIDDQDHLLTNYLKNSIKKKKKEGLVCENLIEELEQAKQRTFRDRFDSWVDGEDEWYKLKSVIEKSNWFMLTNALKGPRYMTISSTLAKGEEAQEYRKERVREGISIYLSHHDAGRKGSYVEAWARSAVQNGHHLGEWFFFAEEPKANK